MPLTKKGMKLKGIFIKEYGRHRGNQIFYAYENKHPDLVKKMPHSRLIISGNRRQTMRTFLHLKKEHPVIARRIKLR